jgi:hypothetical protein
MKKCTLTQLGKSKTGLRESPVHGECDFMPNVHRRFRMVAPPLEDGDLRYISTSSVEKIKEKTFTKESATYIFKTENTEYKLEVIR